MTDTNPELSFTLTLEQANLVLLALTKAPLPSEATNPLVEEIQKQGKAQLAPPPEKSNGIADAVDSAKARGEALSAVSDDD